MKALCIDEGNAISAVKAERMRKNNAKENANKKRMREEIKRKRNTDGTIEMAKNKWKKCMSTITNQQITVDSQEMLINSKNSQISILRTQNTFFLCILQCVGRWNEQKIVLNVKFKLNSIRMKNQSSDGINQFKIHGYRSQLPPPSISFFLLFRRYHLRSLKTSTKKSLIYILLNETIMKFMNGINQRRPYLKRLIRI